MAENPNNIFIYTLTPAGGTLNVDNYLSKDAIVIVGDSANVVLTSNFTISITDPPPIAQTVKIYWLATTDVTINNVGIFIFSASASNNLLAGTEIVAQWVDNGSGAPSWNVMNNIPNLPLSILNANLVGGITLAKLATLTAGQVIVTDSSGNPVALTLTDAQIPIFNSGTNIFAAKNIQVNGNSMDDTGAITVPIPNLPNDYVHIEASFETDEQGTYYVTLPKCTVNSYDVTVTKVVAGTDNGQVQLKNNVGTQLTGSVINVTMGSTVGSNFSTTTTANNTFLAGEKLQILTSKTTVGGRILLSINITKS